jgi:hypothetical protein
MYFKINIVKKYASICFKLEHIHIRRVYISTFFIFPVCGSEVLDSRINKIYTDREVIQLHVTKIIIGVQLDNFLSFISASTIKFYFVAVQHEIRCS